MRPAAIVAFLALLIFPCVAVPDSATTGPYKISFDMGTESNAHNLTTSDPIDMGPLFGEKSIMYNIIITNKTDPNRVVHITMTEYEMDQTKGTDIKRVLTMFTRNSGQISERIIDGSNGAVASMGLKNSSMFTAAYFPFNYLTTVISSTYPWEEGTLHLLDTIHVEKVEAC